MLVLLVLLVMVVVVVMVVMPTTHPGLSEGYLVAVIVQKTKAHAGGKIVTERLVQGIEAGTPADKFHCPSLVWSFGVHVCACVCLCMYMCECVRV